MATTEKVFDNNGMPAIEAWMANDGDIYLRRGRVGEPEVDTIVISLEAFLAICRHLGVTAKELEGSDA